MWPTHDSPLNVHPHKLAHRFQLGLFRSTTGPLPTIFDDAVGWSKNAHRNGLHFYRLPELETQHVVRLQ